MEGLFKGWEEFNEPIGEWDTSNVTSMESMFEGCVSFNQPIGEWKTRRVQSMKSMFAGCASFDKLLSWDTRWAVDMSRMFVGCTRLARTLAFDMREVLSAYDMFRMCPGAKLIAQKPSPDIVEELTGDLGCERLTVLRSSNPIPVYTLGPNRDRCYGNSHGRTPRVQVGVYDTRASRGLVLPELREAVESGRITGTKPLPAASSWPLILGRYSGGLLFGVKHSCLMRHTDPENDTDDVLVVTRRGGVGRATCMVTRSRKKRGEIECHDAASITAFVRVDVSAEPKPLVVGSGPVHESWRTSMAYVPLVVSSTDAPSGHAAEALAATLQLAKRSKRMLVLGAVDSAVLWYLNTCFLADTHQVVLNTRESFEQTRVYALSDRDGVDLERTLADALSVSDEVVVAFVFGTGGASGRAVLSGMDYTGLRYERPRDLGRFVRMFRVSAENPLVRRCSYEFMRYTAASATRTPGARGYMYESEDTVFGKRRYGPVRMAGAFVGVKNGVAEFKNARGRIRIPTADAGFRRAFKSQADVEEADVDEADVDEADVYIKVEPA
jgi:hypothetical protein